ncbi:MAG: hypothetical protein ACRCUP_00565 [Mycoplasmatales bacterium]
MKNKSLFIVAVFSVALIILFVSLTKKSVPEYEIGSEFNFNSKYTNTNNVYKIMDVKKENDYYLVSFDEKSLVTSVIFKLLKNDEVIPAMNFVDEKQSIKVTCPDECKNYSGLLMLSIDEEEIFQLKK